MDEYRKTNYRPYIKWGMLILLIVIVVTSSFYTIRSTERGVLSTFGKMSDDVIAD